MNTLKDKHEQRKEQTERKDTNKKTNNENNLKHLLQVRHSRIIQRWQSLDNSRIYATFNDIMHFSHTYLFFDWKLQEILHHYYITPYTYL